MLASNAATSPAAPILRFDRFEADLVSGELRKRGIRLNLREQSFRVLATLLQSPGQLVTREDLRRSLWHGETYVDFDNNLNSIVAHLRQVLGDSADRPRFIETLPKRGYRFIASVSPSNGALNVPSKNLLAYNEYVQGRYEMWHWTSRSVAKAKRHFEAAIQLDPEFALVYDALANFYWYLGFWGFLPPCDTEPIRRFYALKAIELDPALAETQTLIAFHPEKCNHEDPYTYNWIETESRMKRARDSSPNSALVRIRYASVLMVLGRFEQAIRELSAARELEPDSIEVLYWLALTCFFALQWEPALAVATDLVDLEPEHHLSYMALGLVLTGLNRLDESAAVFKRALELSDEWPLMLGWYGLVLGLRGRIAEARVVLHRLELQREQHFVLPSSFAWIHFGLGETDQAFQWLELALEANDGWIPSLKNYPFLDPYRSDPRFNALIQKLGLLPLR